MFCIARCSIRTALFAVVLAGMAAVTRAGPPYVTDDPEPVELHHWEVYLASQVQHTPDDFAGTLPHIEVNYGVVPDVQLHLIVPDAFVSAAGESRHYGVGDTEIGAKYRFLQEDDSHPQIGLFPLVELPTGSADRSLGTGHTQLFLPIWLQKTSGKFTTYGGGGYWITPGAGNRNSWFVGWQGQYQLTKSFAPGMEIYYRTPQAVGASATAQINLGLVWDLSDNYHVLASGGPAIHGPSGYEVYLAWQWTFGPEKKSGAN